MEEEDRLKEEFQFPPELLEQINECSDGGFVLFSFDEANSPQVFARYDDCKSALALQSFIGLWLAMHNDSNYAAAVNSLINNQEEEEEGDEEDED